MTQSNERATRGKSTEKAVEKVLSAWNEAHSDFAWHRFPDARAAMGRLKAQPSDYLYFAGSFGGLLEVKETKHDYRLPRDKISQLPVMRKFSMAGATNIVLVHHSTTNLWRIAYLSYFEGTPPSWDMSDLPTYASAEAALNTIFRR